MKSINPLLFILVLSALLLQRCGSSSKENSDVIRINDMEIKDNKITSEDGTKGFVGDIESTNLQTAYEGLNFDKAYIVDGDNKKVNSEDVPLNSKFSIVIEGIKNYSVKNGNAFPKLSIMVTGDKGPVVNEENSLASPEGLSFEDASTLRATINVSEPMERGKQYMCAVTILDQNKKDAYIESTWLFTVE